MLIMADEAQSPAADRCSRRHPAILKVAFLLLAIVELIGATTTKTGLKVECALDTRTYKKGIKVSKAEMKGLDIVGDAFHPEWNYTIRPRQQSP